jgi:hypothetical protein
VVGAVVAAAVAAAAELPQLFFFAAMALREGREAERKAERETKEEEK